MGTLAINELTVTTFKSFMIEVPVMQKPVQTKPIFQSILESMKVYIFHAQQIAFKEIVYVDNL